MPQSWDNSCVSMHRSVQTVQSSDLVGYIALEISILTCLTRLIVSIKWKKCFRYNLDRSSGLRDTLHAALREFDRYVVRLAQASSPTIIE